MSKLKPKRTKAYKPKHVRIPVTSLRHEFGLVLRMALETARLGYFSHDQYDRIGRTINCIWGALYLKPPKDTSVILVIEGAMRAMNEAGIRGNVTGLWVLRELEQAAVLAGIAKIEAQLPLMDVSMLYQSMQKLNAMEMAERIKGAMDVLDERKAA
ncbi:MAG: hypothetical protein Q7U37_03140 [Gallionella sp.]|nr:hypothetical protein [Gallionella sp.]